MLDGDMATTINITTGVQNYDLPVDTNFIERVVYNDTQNRELTRIDRTETDAEVALPRQYFIENKQI